MTRQVNATSNGAVENVLCDVAWHDDSHAFL